ncbi:3'(2'),5'-bisphosphate nucleotidase CysQ [Acetobacteraceae bacterium KSS8]|uniref:3'(2'),5'-bisphosphate nucleotidase CysQ n=1 Tax=Endosaccharibacter trunci TaxID=2812733 RepID=A0ABT1W5Y2_9PROT|nr:3'(2'),5'-bisphosphate nucleotidase CysQ [Acetobacteraceae bacterium KSS8]
MKNALIAIAEEAGALILPLFQAGLAADRKSDGSPVTQADERAEALILQRLAAAFPEIPAVGEESVAAGRVPPPSDRFFLVDPLDGTREFVAGSGEFTVNIALIEQGVPTMGVVLAPALGRLFHGDRHGAFEGERKLRVRPPPPEGLVIVASRSHRTAETDAFIARHRVSALVCAGSSLKFCLVASGTADLYPRLGRTMEWDTAAADAILRAAGGWVRTLDGAPLRYGKRNQPADSDFANPFFVVGAAEGLSP